MILSSARGDGMLQRRPCRPSPSLVRYYACGILLCLWSLPSTWTNNSGNTGMAEALFIPDVFAEYVSEGVARDFHAMMMDLEHREQPTRQQHQQKQHNDNNSAMTAMAPSASTTTTTTANTTGAATTAATKTSLSSNRQLQNDIAFCYDALFIADENKNYQVDQNEFVTFIQIMGPPGFVADAQSFGDLPLILQSNFIILACLCLSFQPTPDPQCCSQNPHINNNGTWPGQVPTPTQEQYLYQVCFLTETSIDRLVQSLTPSSSPTPAPSRGNDRPSLPTPTGTPPTEAPEPTVAPTIVETEEPTDEPTTEAPTVSPTQRETSEPTTSPSRDLTNEPSETVVTGSPTDSPSDVEVDTLEPTGPGTTGPTAGPTVEDEQVPTVAPATPEATMEPTLEPSGTTTPTATSTMTTSPSMMTTTTVSPSVHPTPVNSGQVAQTSYSIAVPINATLPTYVPDLIASMDLLAVQVAVMWNANQTTTTGKRRMRHRSLLRSAAATAIGTGTATTSTTSSDSHRQYVMTPGRRRLVTTVEVDLPTTVDGESATICPRGIIDPSTNACKNMEASIRLIVALDENDDQGEESEMNDEEEAQAVKESFESDLDAAIAQGGLQAALNEVNPNSAVVITTGLAAPITSSPTTAPTNDVVRSGGISGGAIAGISMAGAILILGAALYAYRHPSRNANQGKDGEDDDEELKGLDEEADFDKELQQTAGTPSYEAGAGPSSTSGYGEVAGLAAGVGVAGAALSTSGRSRSSSPVKKKKPGSTGQLYSIPGTKGLSDEGSSAGESGWSSNQDMSSVDSKSVDKSVDSSHVSGAGGALAAAAAVGMQTNSAHSSTSARDESSGGDADTGLSLQSTYSELDQAISKGDWAAVGVTAALLASQAYGTDDDSSKGSRTGSRSSKPRVSKKTTLNPQRAAELDALVEAGDWEGVVAAAAKFDAQEALRGDSSLGGTMTGSSSVHSHSNDSPSGAASLGGSSTGTGPSFLSASGTLESTTSPSTFTAAGLTATSDTASTRSKARKLNEVREEVVALVTAVVPEEADNVDEMMTQFRGREEELVETLRSMQERQVAQKARLESQKQAKRDAKANIEHQRKQDNKFDAVDNTGSPVDDQWMQDIDKTSSTGGTLEPHNEEDEDEMTKLQIKEAIENEDWQNVAEAASGLSGHPFSPSSAASFYTSDDMTTASDRSREINDLVDRGDWDGVVAAASRYVDADTRIVPGRAGGGGATTLAADDSTAEERRRRRQERLKEEEEALAQAEIWNAIAEQTKADSAQEEKDENLAGANLAAAWAIDRSLTALKKAEEDDDADAGKNDEGDETDREV